LALYLLAVVFNHAIYIAFLDEEITKEEAMLACFEVLIAALAMII
jgi:hypothetical protein